MAPCECELLTYNPRTLLGSGWRPRRRDGSCLNFGTDDYGQARSARARGPFVALAAGWGHSLGLKADGSCVCWGRNDFGQAPPEIVPGPFLQVAAGYGHSLGLRLDGSVQVWGSDRFCVPTPEIAATSVLRVVTNVAKSRRRSVSRMMALKREALADADSPPTSPICRRPLTQVSCGGCHSLGLTTSGSVVAWGDNSFGQTRPPPGNDFVAVAAGSGHSLALRANGQVMCWGNDENGQAPPHVKGSFSAIAAGYRHSVGLRSGDQSIVCFGLDSHGQAPPEVPGPFVAIDACGNCTVALRAEGSVVCWGSYYPWTTDLPKRVSGPLAMPAKAVGPSSRRPSVS